MLTNTAPIKKCTGVTLIELVVFIIVVSVALGAMVSALNYYVSSSVDPIVQIRAIECAQAKLDEILARKFDENSPTGGIPACGSAEVAAVACAGIAPDADFEDVGDFDGQTDTSIANCSITVTVTDAGSDFGIANEQLRRITVNATSSVSGRTTLTAYRGNY